MSNKVNRPYCIQCERFIYSEEDNHLDNYISHVIIEAYCNEDYYNTVSNSGIVAIDPFTCVDFYKGTSLKEENEYLPVDTSHFMYIADNPFDAVSSGIILPTPGSYSVSWFITSELTTVSGSIIERVRNLTSKLLLNGQVVPGTEVSSITTDSNAGKQSTLQGSKYLNVTSSGSLISVYTNDISEDSCMDIEFKLKDGCLKITRIIES